MNVSSLLFLLCSFFIPILGFGSRGEFRNSYLKRFRSHTPTTTTIETNQIDGDLERDPQSDTKEEDRDAVSPDSFEYDSREKSNPPDSEETDDSTTLPPTTTSSANRRPFYRRTRTPRPNAQHSTTTLAVTTTEGHSQTTASHHHRTHQQQKKQDVDDFEDESPNSKDEGSESKGTKDEESTSAASAVEEIDPNLAFDPTRRKHTHCKSVGDYCWLDGQCCQHVCTHKYDRATGIFTRKCAYKKQL